MANQKLLIDIIANDKSKQALNGVQKGLARLKQSVFNLRNAFIGLGAGVVIKGFVDAGIQIENLEVQLKALFGSAREGKKALKEVTDFAAGTPFELKNIQQGITALATVRQRAEENGVSFQELLKITGNTATVLGGDFALAALQIQRSFSAGISSAELFRERGVRAMAGFKEGVSVNVDESIKGLQKAFGTGGQYGKLLDELSQTLFGTISNLKDAFFIFQVEVSKGFFGALKTNLGDLKKTVEENRKEIREFADVIGRGLSTAINATSRTAKFFKDNIRLITESFRIFIGLKVVGFFYNLAVAIGVAKGAMLGFNATVKKNLLIGGAVIVISQLDRIIGLLKEYAELVGLIEGKSKPIPDRDRGSNDAELIKKFAKMETLSDAIKRNFENVFTSFREANNSVIKDMQSKLTDIGNIIGKSLSAGIKNFSDAFARSVILGEKLSDSFKKMAQSLGIKILSALIEILARKSAELIIEKMITREKQKQAALSFSQNLSGLGSLGSFFKRASGGSVQKGQPYMVGEQGAELFIPNSSGQITQSARGNDTGKPVAVTFNINTLDASGFDEMLIRNRGTITQIINNAVNERGNRNLI
jgi:uncharacterized protein with GYD domain